MPQSFHAFIDELGLLHFQADEFLVATERPLNEAPPPMLWPNICATAIVLDQVRKHFGRATVITSCYRSQAYNGKVGGELGATTRHSQPLTSESREWLRQL